MKKRNMFSLFAATAFVIGFTACNGNNSSSTATTDTTATTNTAVTTQTSSKNYAAMADSFKTNSEAGNYLNPSTGQPYRITVSSAGTLVDENGNPVRHYVDKRTWWVYDANTGDTVGTAKMENGGLRYNDNNGRWITYEERYRVVTDTSGNNSTNGNMNNATNMDSSHSTNNNTSPANTNGSTVNPSDKNVKERG